ncbi:acyltransferase domain-containing protein [Streptomyces zhihengii]|uniref:acyltransferase domain-containing protein n=1 Tax=Streptomyces zhihengii TaxID=1818004 RepID=UPI00367DF369
MTPGAPAPDAWTAALLAQPPRAGVPDPLQPAAGGLEHALDVLAVPAAERPELLATLPDPVRTPVRWEALVRCHQTLFGAGRPPNAADWPTAPAALGAAGRWFYVHLFLLALPRALEEQHRREVPDAVVRDTFADVGAKVVSYRRGHGTGGFDRQTWICRHFRGTLHRLGRLQFERAVYDSAVWGAAGAPAGGPAEDEAVLDVHIPGDGPLSPALCDASFAAARPFMARHHPGGRYAFAACHSWLLDRTLADGLAPGSNILAFQRRFTPHGDRPAADDDVLEFVFGTPPGTADPAALPRANSLQRTLLDRLDGGGHWHLGRGWTPLP